MALNEPPAAPWRVTGLTVLCEGALAGGALLLGLLMRRPPVAQMQWTGLAVWQGLAATLPLVLLLVLAVRRPLGPLADVLQTIDEVVLPLFRGANWGHLLLVALAAGVGEELLFRGVMQAAISQRFDSPLLGLVAASVGFGLMHPFSVPYGVLAALIGAYLGLLAWWTDNLLVPIVTHAVYDFVALALLVRRRGP